MAAQYKDFEIIEIGKTLKGTPWCEEFERMISGMLYVGPFPRGFFLSLCLRNSLRSLLAYQDLM